MRFNNLKAEIVRRGLKQKTIADFLGMSLGNFNGKLNGSVVMAVEELVAIRDEFFKDVPLDDLIG